MKDAARASPVATSKSRIVESPNHADKNKINKSITSRKQSRGCLPAITQQAHSLTLQLGRILLKSSWQTLHGGNRVLFKPRSSSFLFFSSFFSFLQNLQQTPWSLLLLQLTSFLWRAARSRTAWAQWMQRRGTPRRLRVLVPPLPGSEVVIRCQMYSGRKHKVYPHLQWSKCSGLCIISTYIDMIHSH